MRRLGVSIADTVAVSLADGRAGTLRVVGKVVLPAVDGSLHSVRGH